jgi:diguanylate cyclase (GGDEF)-like protein
LTVWFSSSDLRRTIERYWIESTSASRSLLIAVCTIPYMAMYLWMYGYALQSPEIRSGLRVDLMWMVEGQVAVTLSALAGLALWLWPRRQSAVNMPWVEFAVAMLVGLIYTSFAILAGVFSAGPILVLVGVSGVGLLMFQWRVMSVAILVCGGILVGYGVLIYGFGAPYAPALTAGAFDPNGAKWWLNVWQSTVVAVSLPVIAGMVFLLFASQEAMHRQLRLLSNTDGLTGLANRRHFMDRLNAELARQQRSGRPLSVVLLDADRFKQINDRYGHTKGDEVLVALARDLSAGVRTPTDLVARLGGEEFAILLPETELVEADVVCARLQQNVRARVFESASETFALTVSMGVVQALGASADQILWQADAELYQAKRAGRNRAAFSVLRFPFETEAAA